MKYTTFLEKVLAEASKIAKANFGRSTESVKEGDNNQVLTETDLAVGKLIVDAIQEAFPEHSIVDEEAGVIDKGSAYTWVVDPIDGTSNFAAGLPHFGVMIGLLKDWQPIAGGVVLPMFNEVYLAEKGQGAFCNGERIQVSKKEKLSDCLVAYGIDGHQEDPERTRSEVQFLGELILGIRNLRTSNSVFDMAMVASGKYDAYMNQTTKVWDNVPLQILVEEAGGVFTDVSGAPVEYSHCLTDPEVNYRVACASPQLHEQLVALAATHY